jgi:hypothetical protein
MIKKKKRKILKSIYINYDQEKLFNKRKMRRRKQKTIFEITNLRSRKGLDE